MIFSRPRKANLVIPLALILAAALYLLTVGHPANRVDKLFALGDQAIELKPGAEAGLQAGPPAKSAGHLRIHFLCGTGGGCHGLRLKDPGGNLIEPRKADPDEADFLIRVGPGQGPPRVVNAGRKPVTVREYRLEDTLASNSGFPRFALFVSQPATGDLAGAMQWLVILAGMVLITGAVVISSKKHLGQYLNPGALAILAVPLALVLAALGLRYYGWGLVLGWDAYLLACGVGLAMQLLAAPARLLSSRPNAKPRSGGGPGFIAACLPALVLFFYLPSVIYIYNQGDLDYNLAQVTPFAAALGLCLVGVLLLMLYKTRRQAIFKGLFFLGLFLLLRDMVAPLDVGELAGGLAVLDIQEPVFNIILEAVLAVVTLAAAIKVPWEKARPFATILVLLLTVFHGGSFYHELQGRTHFTFGDTPVEHPSPPPPRASDQGNVYQIILDGFSSQVLRSVMSDPKLASAFEGFTFFPRARSNYLFTDMSIPSFMTGSFNPYMKPGESVGDWLGRVKQWTRTATTGGILAAAYANGYTVSQYMNTRLFYPHQKASNLYFGAQLFGEVAVQQAMIRFADLWLLRVAPTMLKQEVWSDENRGVLAGLATIPGDHAWAYWGVRQLGKMTEAEASRPAKGQYVYAHFLMPHRPLVMDAGCKYHPAGEKSAELYRDQAACALSRVALFLAELKRLGRYDDALIVVQSDHATRMVNPISQRDHLPPWLLAELNKLTPGNRAGRNKQNLNLPLILVKPAGATRGPLVVADKLVQLVDLANTIYRSKGWKARAPQGRDLFAPGNDPEVNLIIHIPLKRIHQTDRKYWHLMYDGVNWRMNQRYPLPPEN